VTDKEVDEIIDHAAEAAEGVDPALLDRVSASMGASLQPVRPIAPAWVMASWLLLISVAISTAAAGSLGLFGFHSLRGAEVGAIFPALAIFIWLAALVSVAEMTPGGFRWKNPTIMEPVMRNPAMLLTVVCIGCIAIDAIFFHDYELDSLMAQGIPCLRAGLVVAIPAGVISWVLLRRGFAVNPPAAGLAAGTLAGLAGLTMLELHCPNFRAMHVMIWHTAAIPISALVGSLLARVSAGRPA
jgi:hypothetical protein